MLRHSYYDRQHHAMQGRVQLSLAPASSRAFGDEAIEKQPKQLQAQPMCQEEYDDRGIAGHGVILQSLTIIRSADISCKRCSTATK